MITAIVLAAGKSSRIPGKNKMFLPFRDTTVVSNVIAELITSKVDEILVVSDSPDYESELAIVSQVSLCVNSNPENGLTSSIKTGIVNADPNTNYLVCLGDMPLINSNEYNLLINCFLNSSKKVIIQPSYNNIPGNPILFPNKYRQEILSLENPNGCKPIVTKYQEEVIRTIMPTDHIHLDIDTEEDYNAILNRISKP